MLSLRTVNGDGYKYAHCEFPTLFPSGIGGIDDVEFLLRSGDDIVLIGSRSRKSVYVYPVQQPVGDRGTNERRLEGLRGRLNWSKLGY